MHFRIEVEGVGGSRQPAIPLGRPFGGRGGGGVNAIEKMLKIVGRSRSSSGSGPNTKSHPFLPAG